ncbi:uncharacterized protein LOC135928808 [Gordionus sp. m RMFG-2023]|uniref:uncharacterized protein LOC135928808 n=1 Tax=Gordionus sp. m RMFG-2023 TaxID=3053472 RepID=UPI0031FC5743
MVFIDLEKAYDTVPRNLKWWCLRKQNIPDAYERLMKNIYEASTSCVRMTVGDSKPFWVEIGLHQRSAISPFLFNIIMDTITRDIQKPSPWCMLYADDIILCEETKEKVFEEAEKWSKRLAGYGLKVTN